MTFLIIYLVGVIFSLLLFILDTSIEERQLYSIDFLIVAVMSFFGSWLTALLILTDKAIGYNIRTYIIKQITNFNFKPNIYIITRTNNKNKEPMAQILFVSTQKKCALAKMQKLQEAKKYSNAQYSYRLISVVNNSGIKSLIQ